MATRLDRPQRPSRICHTGRKNDVLTSVAISANPTPMRVGPFRQKERLSCRLKKNHRCRCRRSMNANSTGWRGRTQRHRNWRNGHGSSCWRPLARALSRPPGNRVPGARPPVTGAAGGSKRKHLPASRRAGEIDARGDLPDHSHGCQYPETLEVLINQCSQSELARQSVAGGIVECISHASVGRFLKRGRPQAASQSLLADSRA